jgi:hypothetical protein
LHISGGVRYANNLRAFLGKGLVWRILGIKKILSIF